MEDQVATLGGVESMTARRRGLQVEDLVLVAHWVHRLVDSHGTHPTDPRTAHHLTHASPLGRTFWRRIHHHLTGQT